MVDSTLDFGKTARQGVDRLLLAPVFLLYEIVSVLIPGLLFVVLLFVKGNHSLVAAMQSQLLGYKTKLSIAALFAYVAGKVFNLPANSLFKSSVDRWRAEIAKPGPKLQSSREAFATGVFLLPGLFAREHILDYIIVQAMNAAFQLSTGLVLVVSSLFPGDHLRFVEALVGLVLSVFGYRAFMNLPTILAALLGLAMSAEFQKLFPGNVVAAGELPVPEPKEAQPQVQAPAPR
jgi:hypothetical protein